MFRYNSVDTLPPFLDLARLREDHLSWHDFMISERDWILYLPLVINPKEATYIPENITANAFTLFNNSVSRCYLISTKNRPPSGGLNESIARLQS